MPDPMTSFAYYDARVPTPEQEARYAALYRRATAWIPVDSRVVELGCGTGSFAQVLLRSGRPSSYLGIDFSPGSVEVARSRVGAERCRVDDLRTCDIPDADVYVALEVLEHLDDDLGLLRRLPTGRTVVMSVPSFDSESHVRHFPKQGSAVKRYDHALDIRRERRVRLPNGAYFHLLEGRVR